MSKQVNERLQDYKCFFYQYSEFMSLLDNHQLKIVTNVHKLQHNGIKLE